jgi:DNA-binding transcriptional LysR family regulator
MNLTHLAAFHAVAQEGSVSRGAERLCVSQPAVSKQLRELERSVGAALFYRLSTGVRLTDAGELLFQYAQKIFALESEAETALRDLRGLQRGSLTVGASTTVGTYLLPAVCAEFARRYPNIELRLEINNTQTTQKLLVENAVDLALTEGFVEVTSLSAEAFYEDEIVAVVAKKTELGSQRAVPLHDLKSLSFIARERGSGTREVVERALCERGVSLAPAMTLGHTEAIKRAVAKGSGWAFVSRLAVASEVALGDLQIVDVEGWNIRRPFHRLKLLGKYEGRAVREFLRVVREHCHTLP